VFDEQGRLVFGDSFNHRIKRWDPATDRIETIAGTGEEGSSPAGTPAREAHFTYFGGLAMDASGGIVFTSADNRILRVHPQSGILERIAGEPMGTEPRTRSATAPTIGGPYGVAITKAGRIVFANGGSGSLLAVHPTTHAVEPIGRH
jgi:sugar lactone lactonase YvrE